MISPAKRHYQKAAAIQLEDSAGQANLAIYEQMLLQLADHKRSLKEIQSVERKIEAKRGMIPAYQGYIEGILASDSGRQDDILMTIMVWKVDTGDYQGALDIGRYALTHGLVTPEQYQRDTATLLAEEIAEAAISGAAVPLPTLVQTDELTADRDMPDQVRAKLKRALGEAYASDGQTQQAEAVLNRAIELNPNVGVKQQLRELQRKNKAASG